MDLITVSPDYFHVMGIPLLKGRDFTESDREGAPGAVVANESFARRYFPGEDCLGKRVALEKNHWETIVGVVPDIRGYTYEP